MATRTALVDARARDGLRPPAGAGRAEGPAGAGRSSRSWLTASYSNSAAIQTDDALPKQAHASLHQANGEPAKRELVPGRPTSHSNGTAVSTRHHVLFERPRQAALPPSPSALKHTVQKGGPELLSQPPNVSLDELLCRLADPATLEDPGAYYTFLRQDAPVLLFPAEHFNTHFGAPYLCYVSRYAEAREVMTSPAFQAPDLTGLFTTGTGSKKLDLLRAKFADSIFTVEAAEHARRRELVTRYFSAKHIETLRQLAEGYSRDAVGRVCERLSDGAEVDLQAELSYYVACNTFATFLGVPESDWPLLKGPAENVIDSVVAVVDEQDILVTADAIDLLVTYFSDLVTERRRAPRDDLTSELLAFATEVGLGDEQVADVLWNLWTTGFGTVVGGMDAAVVRAIRHPVAAGAISRSPDGARKFVAETLRIDAPLTVSGALRSAVADTELGGVPVPRGTQVVVIFGAVNRDPDLFEMPDAFIPERSFTRSFTFGHGAHYCVGERLAKMEITIALEELYRRLPSELVIRESVWRRSNVRRSYERLIVAI